jgi:hypothetical protein
MCWDAVATQDLCLQPDPTQTPSHTAARTHSSAQGVLATCPSMPQPPSADSAFLHTRLEISTGCLLDPGSCQGITQPGHQHSTSSCACSPLIMASASCGTSHCVSSGHPVLQQTLPQPLECQQAGSQHTSWCRLAKQPHGNVEPRKEIQGGAVYLQAALAQLARAWPSPSVLLVVPPGGHHQPGGF